MFKSDFERVTGYKNIDEMMAAKLDFDALIQMDLSNFGSIGDLITRAESGEAKAQYQLGNVYYYGSVQYDYKYKPNYPEAMKWYLLAAEKGYAPAMYQVGRVQKHKKESSKSKLAWFRKAAEAGYKWAQLHLGEIYMHFMSESFGLKKDYAEAYFWLSLGTALESSNSNFVEHREIARGYLSPEVLKDVEARLEEWKKTHPPTFE